MLSMRGDGSWVCSAGRMYPLGHKQAGLLQLGWYAAAGAYPLGHKPEALTSWAMRVGQAAELGLRRHTPLRRANPRPSTREERGSVDWLEREGEMGASIGWSRRLGSFAGGRAAGSTHASAAMGSQSAGLSKPRRTSPRPERLPAKNYVLALEQLGRNPHA